VAIIPCLARPDKCTSSAWARLTAAGHSDSLAEFYHPNAVVYPPNMTSLHGKVAIREFFTAMNTMSSPPPVLTLRADSVWGAGS
jgi:ketosteroid isomerase-like protein